MLEELVAPPQARIVYVLTHGEQRGGALAQIAGVSPAATAHHRQSLHDLRIVKFRRDGNRRSSSVDDVHVGTRFAEALHHLAHVIDTLPDHPAPLA